MLEYVDFTKGRSLATVSGLLLLDPGNPLDLRVGKEPQFGLGQFIAATLVQAHPETVALFPRLLSFATIGVLRVFFIGGIFGGPCDVRKIVGILQPLLRA